MDAFQSVWYRLILLFFAVYQTVLWFVLGPSNPWYAVGVVGITFALGPAVAAPVMRRVPPGKKAGLPSLEQGVRGNVSAHGTCFAIHVLLAILALFSRHPWIGALWMLLPGVVVHLYPVLLQRSIMLRLQPLLDKSLSHT